MKLSERLAAASGAEVSPAVSVERRPTDRGRRRDDAPRRDLDFSSLKDAVRDAVVAELGPRLASSNVDETELRARLEHHLSGNIRSFNTTVGPGERDLFFEEVIADMTGWGPLEPLMADSSIGEIMCNAHDEVWVERAGVIERADVTFHSSTSYRQVIDRMLSVAGRRVDEGSPMADGRLPDGSRVNVIIPPVVVGEAVLTIRRFPEVALTMEELVRLGSLSAGAGGFLEAAVAAKLNIVVSGGTGTGKTTLLNVLSSFIPASERVVTIEDAAELRLQQSHLVTLESRPPNVEGAGEVTIRDLVRNALRMRPDRIVVGEVRGGEALDMLQAMNTGHEGSLTSIHANSPRDALARIETMVLFAGMDLPLRAVREQVCSAIDLVVQLVRRTDGARVVDRIAEVQGREGDVVTMQDVFARPDGGDLRALGLRPRKAERIAAAGLTLPPAMFQEPEALPRRRPAKGRSR